MNLKFTESNSPWSVSFSSGMGVRAMKESVANGLSSVQPISFAAATRPSSPSRTIAIGLSDISPAIGRGSLPITCPLSENGHSPAHALCFTGGGQHILIIRPDHNDVVGIMGNRAYDSTPFQAKPLYQSDCKITRTPVSLDYSNFEYIPAGV